PEYWHVVGRRSLVVCQIPRAPRTTWARVPHPGCRAQLDGFRETISYSLFFGEGLPRGVNRPLYIFFAVSGTEEGGFELRRREIDSGVEGGAEELTECSCISLRRGLPIRDWTLRKEPGEHRAYAIEAQRNPCILCRCGHALNELRAERFEPRIDFV